MHVHNSLNFNKTQKDICWLCWNVPTDPWLKLNTNRSFKASIKKIGFGGVIQDSTGRWLTSFSGNIERASCILTEI